MRQHTPDKLKVDVGSVTSREELHTFLAEMFCFPDYYGKNWDAFDECIRDIELPAHIEIIGLKNLHMRFPREADLFEKCISDYIQERGHDIRTARTSATPRGEWFSIQPRNPCLAGTY